MARSLTRTFGSLHRTRFAQAFLLTAGLVLSSSLAPASANPLADSKLVFEHAPQLVKASTTQLAAFVSGGTYEFTLTVPQDAGAPLQAVTISQAANAAKIQFAPDQSHAVANGTTVPISAIGGASSDDVTIAFERPIPPGSTVTISLLAQRNAGGAGVYLFGVTAYPVGDATNGLFLGYGRVSLFNQGG
jgi:hypothetical protein